jgi:ribose-phosphate pyrophosphokinase
VANLITESGADRVLCLDLHAPQIQGFFDVPVDHLYAVPVLHGHLEKMRLDPQELAIVSPDEGRIKLALKFQHRLGGTLAVIDKRRASATETRQANIIGGPVAGKVAIMFDDMISTGGSIAGAATVLANHGARDIRVCATHGLFAGAAFERLAKAPITEIIVTDTVPLRPDSGQIRITQLSVYHLLGEAIRRIHRNESVSFLFDSRLSDR